MFLPDTFNRALALLGVSLFCWGSWGNSLKFSKLTFPQFYSVFGVSIFFWAALLGLVLGGDYYSQDLEHHDFLRNLHNASIDSIGYAMGAGAIFNVANSLLAVLVGLVGLSVSFPICIGIGLIAGTLLTYCVSTPYNKAHTNLSLLCLGLVLAMVALCSMALAHHLKNTTQRNDEETPLVITSNSSSEETPQGLSFSRLIMLCVLCGSVMGCFSPLSALSQDVNRPGHLNPYTCMFFFCLSAMITTAPIVFLLHSRPLDGALTQSNLWSNFSNSSCKDKVWPVLGGLVWTLGTLLNFVSGSKVSFAIAYAIGQAAPVAAALWGIFYFQEFQGAPTKSFGCMGLMFVFYGAAVAALAMSSSS